LRRHAPDAIHESQVSPRAPSLVAQHAPSHPVYPRQGVIGRYIIESSPNGEKRFGVRVVGIVRARAAAQIALYWICNLHSDRLKPLPAVPIFVHTMYLSGMMRILSLPSLNRR